MKTKSFKIDPKILKHLRKRSNLSQKTLALKALSDGNTSKTDSLVRSYQHIERTGQTSLDRATKLASALGVTIRQLQVPSLDDMAANLKEMLQHRIDELKGTRNEAALKGIADMLSLEVEDIIEADENSYRNFAKQVFKEAEYFRLLGETQELQNLADILGVSVDSLRTPTSVNPYWWIWSGNPLNDYLGKLVHNGPVGIIDEIRAHLESIIDGLYSANEIKLTLTKQDKRYLLRCELSESDFKWSLAFCACDVSGDHGIEWVNTTGWEHVWLLRDLKDLFFDYADQVVIEGEQLPPEGKNLVYRVCFFAPSYSEYGAIKILTNWKEYGSRIFSDEWQFRTSLQALLKEHEAENWQIKDSPKYLGGGQSLKTIEISLCENDPMGWPEKRDLKRYQISLGWLNDEGEFFSVPWPAIRRKQFIEGYRQLREAPILVPDEDFVIPRFEPSEIQNISAGDA